jgi:hypothetical protein
MQGGQDNSETSSIFIDSSSIRICILITDNRLCASRFFRRSSAHLVIASIDCRALSQAQRARRTQTATDG